MTGVGIRAVRDDDVGAIVRIDRAVHPHWLVSEESVRHALRARPERERYRFWVAEDSGGVIAHARAFLHVHADPVEAGFLRVAVQEDRRRRGIGSALLERGVVHLRESGAARVLTDAVSDDGRRFLARHGFRHTATRRYSRVDPREVDLAELPELRAAKAAEGFEVVPLGDCRPEDVHVLELETIVDVPFDEPITGMPFDEWLERQWRHPQLTLAGSTAVVHDGRPVTMATLGVEPESGRGANFYTGTSRELRGRGLARLAKLRQLQWAAEHGIGSVVTDNDATNVHMLALNSRLGYLPFAEEWAFVRELRKL